MPGPDIPPIKWGRFLDANGGVHIAPVILNYLMKEHQLAITCPCCPEIQKKGKHTIVIHSVVH